MNSTDPRHLKREGIQHFMALMREKGVSPSTQDKYLQLLNNLLKAYKNFVLEKMKADGVKLPRPGKKPIRVIAEDDLQAIFETVEVMEGWGGVLARGMVSLYFATGIRPSEARHEQLEDLDLEKRTFFVRHPKGEGSWASPSEVEIIREDMLPFLRRYVQERAIRLREAGRMDIPLLSSPARAPRTASTPPTAFRSLRGRSRGFPGSHSS